MALDLDFLTRITNVHWGGGAVFVASGYAEFVLYAKLNKDDLSPEAIEKKQEIFTDLGPLDFTFQGAEGDFGEACYIGAGSYKKIGDKPTFVLGGNDSVKDADTGTLGSGSVVMISHDGRNWTTAFHKQWPDYYGNESGVKAIAWDDDKFCGYVLSNEFYTDEGDVSLFTQVKIYERSLTSSSGESWSDAGSAFRYDSKEVDGEPPPLNLDPPVLFMPHLNPVAELPDGRFGYYEQRDDDGQIIESFLAVPSHVDKYWYLDDQALEPKPSIEITIFKDGAQTKATKTTPINVICAAYASGILMVGGQTDDFRATIAASIDDGDTWEIVWSGPEDVYQQVNTISAAPLSDL